MTDTPPSALVTPFAGERYVDGEKLSDRLAPPYDAIPAKLRGELAARDPHNIVHLILPEGNEDKYDRAALLLKDWRAAKVLQQDGEDSVYVVEQAFDQAGGQTLTRTGVIAAIAVEPFSRGRVKPHEKTHAEPKADRLALLDSTKTMCEALLMLARDENGELSQRLAEVVSHEPQVRAHLGGVDVAMWQVVGARATALANAAGAAALYIADGHHRYETAVAYRKVNPAADRTLGTVVALGDPGLKVLPTHRLVYGDAADIDGMLSGCRDRLHVHELSQDVSSTDHLVELEDRGTACIIVRPGGNPLALLLKAGAKLGDLQFANEPTVASLDVARIDELVVKPLLATVGEGARLGYSADPKEVVREVVHGAAAFGVMLNPTSVEQVLAVADAGSVMPQKATFFSPKVPSGLVLLGYEG